MKKALRLGDCCRSCLTLKSQPKKSPLKSQWIFSTIAFTADAGLWRCYLSTAGGLRVGETLGVEPATAVQKVEDLLIRPKLTQLVETAKTGSHLIQ
jgi:hypothetical protein